LDEHLGRPLPDERRSRHVIRGELAHVAPVGETG